jgi:hypothetical protein
MNATVAAAAGPLYTSADKAIILLLGALVVPLMGWFVFVIARRRLRLKDSLKSRAYLFYQILAGVLLGQFMCHTWVGLGASALDARFMFLFALLGCNLLLTAETIGRLWNTNPNYMGPMSDDSAHDEYALDRQRMEEQSVVIATNVGSTVFAENTWGNLDHAKQMRKRNWMLGVVVVIFTIISVMDGMLLIYRAPRDELAIALTILAYYINGISMTLSIFGAALHAKWHVLEERRVRLGWWFALTLGWAAVTVGTAVPTVVGVTPEQAQAVIAHRAFLPFYGLASGAVLVLFRYYYNRKMDNIERREAFWGEVVFWLATAQAAFTGFLL